METSQMEGQVQREENECPCTYALHRCTYCAYLGWESQIGVDVHPWGGEIGPEVSLGNWGAGFGEAIWL